MMQRRTLVVMALVVMAVFSMQISDAWARAGSGGSRGSRSYSSPARPSPATPANPSSPSTLRNNQPTSPTTAARPGGMFGGGLMGGIAGFALGGLLGSMLFGGMGGGGFGGGIGMLEILLIGGGLFLLYRFMKSRREAQQPAYATAGAAYGAGAPASGTGIGGTATMEMPAGISDLDRGIAHIQQMDPAFDVTAVAQLGRETFTSVQGAVMANNMAPVAGRLTSRMYTELQNQCDKLRATRQTNRLERIDVQRADVTEAWQESGQDYVTVYLEGTLLDYTMDDGSGRVVAGSNTVTEPFREFWTFVRPVGPNVWKLSAIQLG
jgi:predicted lipid-binding transport protein (Tim44 family)